MSIFIIAAARAFLDAVDNGDVRPDPDDWDAQQIDALRDEVTAAKTTPENKHQRAERGRLSVEIFGMNDDVETLAADVIADILHWVTQFSGPHTAGSAYFRAAGYYHEERS